MKISTMSMLYILPHMTLQENLSSYGHMVSKRCCFSFLMYIIISCESPVRERKLLFVTFIMHVCGTSVPQYGFNR